MLTNERIKELNAKIAQLQEWEALAKEAAAEAEAIKDEIKAVMNEQANLTAFKHTKSLSYNKRYCVIDGQLRTLFLYSKTYH